MMKTLSEYRSAGREDLNEWIRQIESTNKSLTFHSFTNSVIQLPRFNYSSLGINFIYIPGGNLNMGLSENEESDAKLICDPPPMTIEEMRPVIQENVTGFFVSETPVLIKQALDIRTSHHLQIDIENDDNPFQPYFCDFDTADQIAKLLNCKLPVEKQWEYMCRADTNTLFCFGNSVPAEDELEKWLAWDLNDLSKVNKNNFGISGLFFGEWCADMYKSDYSDSASIMEDARTIRGGGAYFWPWQDEEWVWCASAMRMPSTDLIDNQAAFRLIIEPVTS